MLFRILLWAFILVIIVRFLVRFVFPILSITRSVQGKVKEMQQKMEEMQQQQNVPPKQAQKVKEGDYIDYEEVK